MSQKKVSRPTKTKQVLRNTGIDIIGDVPWGTHFCQFYQTKEDLLDVLVPYFKAGLESNEKCIWVTSEFLDTEEATLAMKKAVPNLPKYLKRGQIEIFPHTEWYLKGGVFEMKRVLNDWVKKHDQALKDGFSGSRVSGNPFWLDSKKEWDDFAKYEAEINNVIDKYKLVVLCTYSLPKCTSYEVIDVVTNHEFALIKRKGKWENIESATHRKMEDALRKSEQRHRSFIELTGNIGWITNADGEVDEDMPSWRNYTGQSYDEIKGSGWIKALHPDDVKHTAEVWRKAVREKSEYETEYRILGKDGVYRYFLARGIPVFGQKKEIREWVGTCIDITKIKELDQKKDQFISIASHELKTPLTSIKIYGQLIEKHSKAEKNSRLLGMASRFNSQVNILQDYINELLDVNKMQTGKLMLSKTQFDMYALINECINFQSIFTEHKLVLMPEHQKVRADKERIRQVLINLITNAVRYSPNSKKIVISAKKMKDNIIISVQDFGIGIPKDQLEKVFDKFYQVEFKKNHGGLGLGLFISKDIVERHGGKIWAESKEGKGSTFYFSLPIKKTKKTATSSTMLS